MGGGRDDKIYGQGVFRRYLTHHGIPPLPPQHQLEASDVGAVETEQLNRKLLRLMVEEGDTDAVWDKHVGNDKPVPRQLPHADSSRDICWYMFT